MREHAHPASPVPPLKTLARVTSAVLLGGLGASCCQPALPTAPEGPGPSLAAPSAPLLAGSTSAPGVPAPGTSASAGPTALPPAAATSSTEAATPPADAGLLPARSSSGTTYCGTVECDSTREACCFDFRQRAGRCVEQSQSCTDREQRRECDEAGDCGGRQLCCVESTGTYTPSVLRCSSEPLCPGSINGTPELGGEVCMPGSSCRGTRTCAPHTFRPGFPGYCYAPPSVRCGSKVCAGDTPICDFDASDPAVTGCVDASSTAGLGCASPEDCAGYPCLLFGDARYRCGDLFAAGMLARGALCKQVQDCPVLTGGSNLVSVKALGCRLDAGLPAGVKRCVYPRLSW